MIGIVNYGSGNIQAIANIYSRLNIPTIIITEPSQLHEADKLILPGVGAFDETMNQLIGSGLKEDLDKLVLHEKKPILGICVGMQIMAESSEEGTLEDVGHVGFLMLAHYAITRSRRHKQISAEHSYAMLKLSTLLDQN